MSKTQTLASSISSGDVLGYNTPCYSFPKYLH
jgi:hypothetical protein